MLKLNWLTFYWSDWIDLTSAHVSSFRLNLLLLIYYVAICVKFSRITSIANRKELILGIRSKLCCIFLAPTLFLCVFLSGFPTKFWHDIFDVICLVLFFCTYWYFKLYKHLTSSLHFSDMKWSSEPLEITIKYGVVWLDDVFIFPGKHDFVFK